MSFKTFTMSNCGLEKKNVYPELGSVFKAAFMKAACWFFTKTAIELAEKHPAATSPKSKSDFFGYPELNLEERYVVVGRPSKKGI